MLLINFLVLVGMTSAYNYRNKILISRNEECFYMRSITQNTAIIKIYMNFIEGQSVDLSIKCVVRNFVHVSHRECYSLKNIIPEKYLYVGINLKHEDLVGMCFKINPDDGQTLKPQPGFYELLSDKEMESLSLFIFNLEKM